MLNLLHYLPAIKTQLTLMIKFKQYSTRKIFYHRTKDWYNNIYYHNTKLTALSWFCNMTYWYDPKYMQIPIGSTYGYICKTVFLKVLSTI